MVSLLPHAAPASAGDVPVKSKNKANALVTAAISGAVNRPMAGPALKRGSVLALSTLI
jgi:hypothetical protein